MQHPNPKSENSCYDDFSNSRISTNADGKAEENCVKGMCISMHIQNALFIMYKSIHTSLVVIQSPGTDTAIICRLLHLTNIHKTFKNRQIQKDSMKYKNGYHDMNILWLLLHIY